MTSSDAASFTFKPPTVDEVEALQADLTAIGEKMKKGMTPGEAMHLDHAFLESLYGEAYHLYQTGKYVESAEMFRTLLLMNSMEFKYAFGLAACYHLLKEYDNAVKIYTICSILNPDDPLPHYHASDCYIENKDFPSALVSLKMTLKIVGDREEFKTIKERSLLTLEGIKQHV